jgi:hypothetical protein
MPGFDNSVVYFEKGIDPRGVSPVANQMTTGTLLIGSSVSPYVVCNTLTAGTGIGVGNADGAITISNTAITPFASVAETKVGTSTTKALNPADLIGYMNDLNFTGFVSWAAGGPYFDDTTLGSFTVSVGGTGYINGQQITWTGPQTVSGMTAGNTYYIYIDSTGTIGKASTRTDALFLANIVLFECMRDSTPVTNNQVTVKENHPYDYPATVSNYEHDNIGTLIENNSNGANITINGTQGIQINGADVLSDHGLETTIPDSGGSAVTWIRMYTTAGGKWARQNATTTFTGFYNNAGTPTALGASSYGVYTLYVSKDTLTTTTPTYFAVLNTAQFANLTAANTAISNGSTAKSSNELNSLELCQLGYIIYQKSSETIVQVTISKQTLKQTLSTSGTNTAALVNTSTTNFNGWLSSANTNVQSALDELDDSTRYTEVTGATQAMAVNRSYSANRGTLVTFTLPATAIVGDEVAVTGIGAGGWLIAQNANQYINNISVTTTIGVGGSLASTNKFDSVKLVCTTINNGWNVVSGTGNWTVV